jgi:hypothetical protein
MPNIQLVTFKDLINHCSDYLGASTSEETERFARRAVLAACRELANGRRWSYYLSRLRVTTNASQTTGTIDYDHTGGVYERQLTITDGTWPDWAKLGTVLINDSPYDIADYKSASVLTLGALSNPGEDVAAGATYTLYRDTYVLPSDFISIEELINVGNAFGLSYQHPGEWLTAQRTSHGPATPRFFTITGDPNYFGNLAMRFFPAPDDEYQIDGIYQRRPRSLALDEYEVGSASVSISGTTVTGSGTNWTDNLVGAVIRFSSDAIHNPTGLDGAWPYQMERVVWEVQSTTSLVIDSAASETLSGVKYSISDPIDIESGAMLNFLQRECERQMRILRRMKSTSDEEAQYAEARIMAWEADSRSFGRRALGEGSMYRPRLADMPRGADVS